MGAHTKHLRNLYVYFWRWATWKVFDHHPEDESGIVCFITVAGFLNGPGFQKMRDYLRRTSDEIWVIDCSPDGHQPKVSTRIFQGVQQPVCIVLASRSPTTDDSVPATVRFQALPLGHRSTKFEALAGTVIDGGEWVECPSGWRDPFLPASLGAWSTYPAIDDLFVYDGSGVMPGRTWVIAPDVESLTERWETLIGAAPDEIEDLFHPHLRSGQPGDKHSGKVVKTGLTGHPHRPIPVSADQEPCISPIPYAVRSFDRQWIIPDGRLINQPNPGLWTGMSSKQSFITAPHDRTPSAGPALTTTALMPDLHHYHGRGGRAIPLWLDANATLSNVKPGLVSLLAETLEIAVEPEDVFAYVAAVVAHPTFTSAFAEDLSTAGLHVPLTAEGSVFTGAVELGRRVLWLHSFGERYVDAMDDRPAGSPRLPDDRAPKVPATGVISTAPDEMADCMDYDAAKHRLLVGQGFVEKVTAEMWAYEVSGMNVLSQWFSYRRADRERPIIGDRRPPSRLTTIQPDHWLPEYTTDLLDILNVLGLLIDLEPQQADVLETIRGGELISMTDLQDGGALVVPDDYPTKPFSASSTPDDLQLDLE